MASIIDVSAQLESKVGFYVGDICYELPQKDYDEVWGEKYDYEEGEYEIRDSKFAVGRTAYGDGRYEDESGHYYDVDAGVIGIIPYELCEDKDIATLNKMGKFVAATKANFSAEDGVFDIEFDTKNRIHIDTGNHYEEDDDEDYGYYDDDDEDEDDEEE